MIRQKDGIHFQLNDTIVADSRSAEGDINIVTHGHSDHAPSSDGSVVCSDETARIVEERNDIDVEHVDGTDRIELHSAGHIVGSRAALIHGEDDILYTGDVATRDRAYLDGFEPIDADVLVTEATYGIPAYTFPPQDEIEERIRRWITEQDRPLFLFGYSLGKAQKIQHLAQQATEQPIIAHGAVHAMNQVVGQATDLTFDAVPYSENKELVENGLFVLPSRLSRADWVDELADELDAVKAGFSGWAAQDSYQYRGGYDEAFTLSDHCDFDELIDLVEQVDPDRVYTQHGFDEALASRLRKEHRVNARPLKKNQSSLTDF
ncbi:MAG: mRNA cleavage and polyadenylation specificity factor-like protein [Candidatus Nanohaloarchaea archaeon]|nr:mRNA cleavage and polyadenylation specificity factor-like protein [Candidatus Nanohaloarchaea archaeon]